MCNPTLLNAFQALTLAADAPGTKPHGWFMPEAASNHVASIDPLMDFINIVTVVFFVLIILLMVGFVLKFRRRTPEQKALSQASHSTGIEMGWTLPPLVIVIACFIWGFRGYLDMNTFPEANAYEVQVTAQQFSWTFTHPNGFSESNILQVPAGKKVKLTLTSNDVIHSLFVPDFRVKKDVVRGRYNHIWFIADGPTPGADLPLPTGDALTALARESVALSVPGELNDAAAKDKKPVPTQAEIDAEVAARVAKLDDKGKTAAAMARKNQLAAEQGHIIFCTEMCGTGHSLMAARVVVHDTSWATPEPDLGGSPGERLFKIKGCAACHMPAPGAAAICPNFTHMRLFGKKERVMKGGFGKPIAEITVDEEYLRTSITNPLADVVEGFAPAMPLIPMTDEEVTHIVNYLKDLNK
jgi:cytochrome c oxidase subunit 2